MKVLSFAADGARNSRTASVTFSVDPVKPTISSYTAVVLSIEGVVGTMAWNGNNVTFSPASALAHLGSYTVSVSGRDLAGNSVTKT
jgi:hypothetical protein